MSGESDLKRLLQNMAPQLRPEEFVFCCFADFRMPAGVDPICTFREADGLTAIIERSQADRAHVVSEFVARLITLTVHSSLGAVGFLASVATALARAGIPCNAVAAYHHDHLFVPADRADEAMAVLAALASHATTAPDV